MIDDHDSCSLALPFHLYSAPQTNEKSRSREARALSLTCMRLFRLPPPHQKLPWCNFVTCRALNSQVWRTFCGVSDRNLLQQFIGILESFYGPQGSYTHLCSEKRLRFCVTAILRRTSVGFALKNFKHLWRLFFTIHRGHQYALQCE